MFTISFAGNSQTARVRHYTINEGLANNAVYSIAQDKKGLMWFGSIDGLHSYDGYEIRVWRDQQIESLGSNIYTINEDENQQLWIGSDLGLCLFNLKTESFVPFDVQTQTGVKINSPVSHIIMDSKALIWISTVGQGLFRYNANNNQLEQYTGVGKINSDDIVRILEDSNGDIWVASLRNGVSRYIPEEDLFQVAAVEGAKNILTLFEDSKQNIWVGTSGSGLYLLDKQNKKLIQKLEAQSGKRILQIRSIVEWKPGELLIASDEGLIKYDTGSEKIEIIEADESQYDKLNDSYLQTLFIDREEALWIGTYFGGVNYVPPFYSNFKLYNQNNSQLNGKIVSGFAEADNNNLWIGTDDAGFSYWDRSLNRFKSYNSQHKFTIPTYHNIHALLQDDDKLYIGMYMGGLDILDLKSGSFKNHKSGSSAKSLYSSGVYALYRDSYGQIWVGTTTGLNMYNRESDDFDRIFNVHPADVSYITEDGKGYMWVCSLNKGIFRLDQKAQKWEHFSLDDQSEVNTYTDKFITACVDDNQDIWFGTDGSGLLKYNFDSEKFEKVTLSDNIRVVYKIFSEGDELWLTTNNGMYCYTAEDGRLRYYNKWDGLQDNLFLPNSGIQLKDGTIFVGGINGFNEFHPNQVEHDKQETNVILSDFQLFNKTVKVSEKNSPLSTSITYAENLTLEHKHSVFSFNITTLSYTNPSKNQYRYRLSGFEQDWIESRNAPRVTYTNLPAGDYTFQVSSSKGDGVWVEDVINLPIKVLPPWWWSAPFIGLYVVLAIGFMVLVYYRIHRAQQKKILLLAIEKDKELYHSKMEFFTLITHEIRTPLTLILAPLEDVIKHKGSVKDAMPQLLVIEHNAKRLLSLVNQLMDFRKVELGGMQVTLMDVDVKSIVSEITNRFSLAAKLKGVEVVLSIADEECYAKINKEAFTKVMSNLLSNALKFTESHIWINLAIVDGSLLELKIRDNGRGIALEEQEQIFTPFYQVKEGRPKDDVGTGVGLLLVKKLTDLMGGKIKLESEVGVGSTFTIRFELSDRVESALEAHREALAIESDSEQEQQLEERYHILVVDDNKELLSYLTTFLSEDYRVTCASNGEEALDILDEILPDLIISDVMMPKVSGVELCERVKQNLRTSHIPFILLTAKVETSDFVEGLETGADLYIGKPFSPEIIKAQIKSILLNREKIKGNFKIEPLVDLKSVANSQVDTLFLEKISAIIEERIADTTFTVDELAREAGISRTGLFTKIKAVAGMTPNDLIRVIRLKKATELLALGNLQINEISFKVGFSSPSYFTKCFQDHFGVVPTEYMRRKSSL